MSLDQFLRAPWKHSHDAYEASAINIRPAPEFATAEVVLAATYRSSGFSGHTESKVPVTGRQFDKMTSAGGRGAWRGTLSQDSWRTVLHGALESPKQPKQSSKRFLQLCQLVPDAALYSGSARLAGNSWHPGSLIQRAIGLGGVTKEAADTLWALLHQALSVKNTDDVWARWLQQEFVRWRDPAMEWRPTELDGGNGFPESDKKELRAPAVQFVKDLTAVVKAKPLMTRRQWVSLLEAVMRVGAVSHVMWLCDVNNQVWRTARRVLAGDAPPSRPDVLRLVANRPYKYLIYGKPGPPMIREFASSYLQSRLGLNLLLWRLDAIGQPTPALRSVDDLTALLCKVAEHRTSLAASGFVADLRRLEDQEARTLGCRKGIGANLVEFGRHTLGQRQTLESTLRGYDQGYALKKKGDYSSAPWVSALGPVALLAFVHCCLAEVAGPRSVRRLCEHLAWYGLQVDMDNVTKGDLGRELKMLGLILDSPDAEGGMLLVPPFEAPVAVGASQ